MIRPPSNKELSLTVSRLDKLLGRLESNEAYGKDYQAFMKEFIDKGYAERVPAEELALENNQTWHILHHGVYHPTSPPPPPPKKKKRGKIRVVFYASAEYKGSSLNRHLLQGPDLANNLTGVLCCFWKDPSLSQVWVISKAIISPCGHQPRKQKIIFLKFLWWEEGDMEKPLVESRMTVSSPECCNLHPDFLTSA